MDKIFDIPLFDMIISLSHVINIIDNTSTTHQEQVAYISYRLAEELDCSEKQRKNMVLAAAIHDIGAFSYKDRAEILEFDIREKPKHAEIGYLLIKEFAPLANIAPIIRYHHSKWNYGHCLSYRGKEVPIESHILSLADRIAILIDGEFDILNQRTNIIEKIKEHSGVRFNPTFVEAFLNLAKREEFWLRSVRPNIIKRMLMSEFNTIKIRLNLDGLLNFSKLFSKIIDFRSSFTATHSKGVAVTAQKIAELMGWLEDDYRRMKIAGYFHDLGKLAMPKEILEKPGKLTQEEMGIIKSHTFYTYEILDPIKPLEEIKEWAAFHHERVDGRGYPFHRQGDRLPTGSKIMGVADVFSAITETRPYRSAMSQDRALDVLTSMVESGALDSEIVTVVNDNYRELNFIRNKAQGEVITEYSNTL
ncbi:HD-GYP domain-containing protein [Orenia marismortui]|uniref:Putative nucleotidyltransferase with HDIG domain n=1 Tax=Orenia marismortui TaxID=46469 RepID=A0A4R8HAW8_9FIRM|nr:HD domain-containing phosphohydrolase [Orenia marismortui]TDX53195.1 putative nucleotidyltransferase with HDIG domain [Orenia marismortui]